MKHTYRIRRAQGLPSVPMTLLAIVVCTPWQIPHVHAAHEYLLDDHVIGLSSNAARSPVPARKYPTNPVLEPTYPWESPTRVTSPSVFVDRDANKLRMFYWTGLYCAAESTNGRTWTRTMMNQHPAGGYALTNIVMPGSKSFWVMENPRPDLLANSKYIGLLRMTSINPGSYIVTSMDGLTWDASGWYRLPFELNDTLSSFALGPDGKFRTYSRDNSGGYRKVVMSESEDLINWSMPRVLMDNGPVDQIYGLQVRELDGVYVSLREMFHVDEGKIGTLDCEIVTSRDAVRWDSDFPGTAVIPNGPPGSWDAGIAYHNSSIFEWQGRWMAAYGGGPQTHGTSSPLDVGIVEFDRGRLFEIAQDAPGQTAVVITNPLETSGAELLVNADLGEGTVSVGVLDADFQALEGYEYEACTLSPYDDLRYRVQWDGHSALPAGDHRLYFMLSGGAKLFAFEGPALYEMPPPPPEPPRPPMMLGSESQHFGTAAGAAEDGWAGHNNTLQGSDYGFRETTQKAGGSPGEAGGTFHRCTEFNYYADTSIGAINSLEAPLAATGRLFWENDQDWSGGQVIGWFNTTDGGWDNVLGFVLHDPSVEGMARMEARVFFDNGADFPRVGTVLIPTDTPLTFLMTYDPAGGDGFGQLRIEFFDETGSIGALAAVLAEGDKDNGMDLNAFGIHCLGLRENPGLRQGDFYFDDLVFTVATLASYGDATVDGRVDDDDLSVLLSRWGTETDWAGGEFTGDGLVNDDDLSVLLVNWTGGNPDPVGVPEPATLALVSAAAAVLLRLPGGPQRHRGR